MNAINSFIVDKPDADFVAAPAGKAATQRIIWINDIGYTLYVFTGYVWMGVSKDDIGDASYTLYNATQGIVYLDSNDDHYENRGGLPENKDWLPSLAPNAFVVNPNDQINLDIAANADAGTPLVIQAYARLYYTLQ